ncbi:MAG TPA: hypothetical protein VK013_03270 [Myxococcaceae bacterium]|nr:hypothetical protein [Myxococcaceae bacterium]
MSPKALLLPALLALGCTGSAGAQRGSPEARAELSAGLQRPYYTEADVKALSELLMAEPVVAEQLQTEEELERVLACIYDEANAMVPTVAAALELGEERLGAINEAIGKGCMEAHRSEVLLGEAWSESFTAVYASACEANAPELGEMCRCVGAQAPRYFESPASFNQLEQALETGDGPDSEQQAKFDALIEACAEVGGEAP